jgi:hypothetical protein
MRARSATEVGQWSWRRNHIREPIDCPPDQTPARVRYVAAPTPRSRRRTQSENHRGAGITRRYAEPMFDLSPRVLDRAVSQRVAVPASVMGRSGPASQPHVQPHSAMLLA